MKMKAVLAIYALMLGGLWSCQHTVGKDDIYVNRLVYLKNDSSFFTGTLRKSNRASVLEVNFCNGVQCGEWGEYQNGGGVVQEGEILDPNTLSKATQELISPDTFSIDYWAEGGSITSKNPTYLTVEILKDEAFFLSDKKQYDSYLVQLAYAVLNDTRNLKYDYLKIRFVDAVYNWHQYYSKEYKQEKGNLVITE